MLAGGGNLIQVFLYLVRLIDMGAARAVKPMIAFIGVRMSWDMLLRKAVLARLACSAVFSASTRSIRKTDFIPEWKWETKRNKSYFTYKRAEQGETLKKVEENYKILWNMWKKYGRMGEKRKVVFKMLLNVQRKF